jgi:hypothetical protein
MFNQRTILGALNSIQGHDEQETSLAGRPVAIHELVNVLVLLESITMSNRLFLDGTLPPGDLFRTWAVVQKVEAASATSLNLGPITPGREELLPAFKDSAETASLLIVDSLNNLDHATDQPLEGDIGRFVGTVIEAHENPWARCAMASEIADAASSGRETFRGSKCVAGLISAECEDLNLLAIVAERLRAASESGQRIIAALLINRFRINYANSLAGMKKAMYLADVSIEDLKATQVMLFWRYMARKIAERYKADLTPQSQSLFDSGLGGAPLGFAILMNTTGSSPYALIEEALKMRDRGFIKASAADTPQERYLHQMTETEFAAFQENLFGTKWMSLVDHGERAGFVECRWRHLRIPAALGAAVGGVLGALSANPLLVGAGAVAGSFIGNLTEDLVCGRFGGARVNSDHYRKLDGYIRLAAAKDRIGQALSQHVEALFHRPLEAPATSAPA